MNMNAQRGMSLIELMIAMTLGLLLTLGIASLFMQSRTSFSQDEQIAGMQANMRFAMEVLVRDITMSGYLGGVLNTDNIDADPSLTLAAGGDCGPSGVDWVYDLTTPIGGVNDASAAGAAAAHSCIDAGEFLAGTDVVAIKRTRANPIMDSPNLCPSDFNTGQSLADDEVYMADNGVNGLMFIHQKTGGVLDGCVENRVYRPAVYYIRPYSIDAGDGIPTLCRKVLDTSGTPTMGSSQATECMVEGIEQLQVQYGIDTNANGVANQYVSNPSAAQLETVTAVRIHILARSLREQPGYDNDKTYVLGDWSGTPADSFYRRAATTTVLLRNPTNMRNF